MKKQKKIKNLKKPGKPKNPEKRTYDFGDKNYLVWPNPDLMRERKTFSLLKK